MEAVWGIGEGKGGARPLRDRVYILLTTADIFTQNPLPITTVRQLDAEPDDFVAEQSVTPTSTDSDSATTLCPYH